MMVVTTPTQQTSKRLVFANCRLGRSELDRIFAVASEGIAATQVGVATQRHDTRYEAGSLADLIDSLAAANAPGDLNSLTNVTLHAEDDSSGRKAVITIDTERTVVVVEGADATWVLGQAARLEMLIRQSGGVLVTDDTSARRPESMTAYLLSLSWVLTVAGGLWFLDAVDPELGQRFGLTFIPLLFGPVLLFVLVARRYRRRANRPVLQVSGEVPRGSWWYRLSPGDRIVFVSVVVAGVGVLVTVIMGVAQIQFGK
jgi:hypothetical protein